MSGRLFKTEPISQENGIRIQREIINKIHEKYDNEIITLGSIGHKSEPSGDIDLGVKVESFDELQHIIEDVFDYTDTVENKSIYIMSIKYPYIDADNNTKYVSVDFIQVSNIEFTKFRYYCPNYIENESKYKVGTKIMFLGTLLNHCEEPNVRYDFSPIGLYKTTVNIEKRIFVKEFVTDDPQYIVDKLLVNGSKEDLYTVESIWEALHSDKYRYPNELKSVELSLFVNSYRKGWEEQVKPEDFSFTYWTTDEINENLKIHTKLRNINKFLHNMSE